MAGHSTPTQLSLLDACHLKSGIWSSKIYLGVTESSSPGLTAPWTKYWNPLSDPHSVWKNLRSLTSEPELLLPQIFSRTATPSGPFGFWHIRRTWDGPHALQGLDLADYLWQWIYRRSQSLLSSAPCHAELARFYFLHADEYIYILSRNLMPCFSRRVQLQQVLFCDFLIGLGR